MKYVKGKLYFAIIQKDLFTGPVGFVLIKKESDIKFAGTLQPKTVFVLLDFEPVVDTFYRIKALTPDGEIAWFLSHENQVLPIEELT